MNHWIEMGLSNAAMATALAIIAAAVSRWGRRPTVAHALWVLVLVKLITPSFVSVPLWRTTADSGARPLGEVGSVEPSSGPAADVREQSPALAESAWPDPAWSETGASAWFPSGSRRLGVPAQPGDAIVAGDGRMGSDLDRTRETRSDPNALSRVSQEQVVASKAAPAAVWPRVAVGLGGVWLIGIVVYFGRVGWQLARFRRLMNQAQDPQPQWQAFVDRMARRIGLSRSPRVVLVPGTVSPMVFAAGRRTVLIVPKELVGFLADESQLETLIAHELAHLCRGDHWIRRLELVVSGLYWWLPTVWLTRRGLREVEEEICDAWVVKTLPSANRSYAEALLNTVDFLSGAKPLAPPACSSIGHFRFMKRRIVMIMRGSVATRLAWSGRLMVLLFAVAFLPLSFGSADAAVMDEGDEPVKVDPANDPPEFSFIKQRSDDDDDEEQDRQRRRDRRRRDARDDDDDDDDADVDIDVDELRAEVLAELKSELAELNDELAEAMEEVREELTEELRSAPPELQKIISKIDIDGLLEEVLEDAPAPVRTFVDGVNIQSIIKEALQDADLDDVEIDGTQADAMQKMIMKEVTQELKGALGEMSGELRRAQAEVRRAMRTAPPEVRQMLEEIDFDELLEGSLPIVKEMVGELDIEEIVEEALEDRPDRNEREARRDRDDDEDDRDARRGNREELGDIEQRLERRLDQLMREADEIRQELRQLRQAERRRDR